jgi:hypothetical protein
MTDNPRGKYLGKPLASRRRMRRSISSNALAAADGLIAVIVLKCSSTKPLPHPAEDQPQ